MDPSTEALNQQTSSKIFYFLVKIKWARSVTISVCLLKACRQVEGTFLNILTKPYYITCSYSILTFPKHFTPVLKYYSALGCKPGQHRSRWETSQENPENRWKLCGDIRNTPASSGCLELHLFSKALGGLKSNAAPSTTTNINHRAQTSWCEEYRNVFGSNVLFFPIQPERGCDGHQGTKHFSATWQTATRNAAPGGTFLQSCTYAPRWV